MDFTFYFFLILAIAAVVLVKKALLIIPQSETKIIERLGRYHDTLSAGVNFIIPFIDNAGLIEEHSDMYAGDGVHLQTEFYPYWAQNQLLGIYDLKNGRTSDGHMLDEQDTDSSEKDGK